MTRGRNTVSQSCGGSRWRCWLLLELRSLYAHLNLTSGSRIWLLQCQNKDGPFLLLSIFLASLGVILFVIGPRMHWHLCLTSTTLKSVSTVTPPRLSGCARPFFIQAVFLWVSQSLLAYGWR